MVKIWRNRIEAGTKTLAKCPVEYRAGVIEYIQNDLEDGSYTVEQLKALVSSGKMTEAEYEEITGEPYAE